MMSQVPLTEPLIYLLVAVLAALVGYQFTRRTASVTHPVLLAVVLAAGGVTASVPTLMAVVAPGPMSLAAAALAVSCAVAAVVGGSALALRLVMTLGTAGRSRKEVSS